MRTFFWGIYRVRLIIKVRKGGGMGLAWEAVAKAARELGVCPCFIWAVASNESGVKGFDGAGQVLVRFERHVFKRELRKRGLAQTTTGEVEKLEGVRWDTVHKAVAIHEEAALRATSFGMFQIMGFNHEAAGFGSVRDFVAAQAEGTQRQLESFCAFVRHERLAVLMKNNDYKGFARRYNGPAFADNQYDSKLEKAHKRCLLKKGLMG